MSGSETADPVLLDPEEPMSPREGARRYLNHREGYLSESTLDTYEDSLNWFIRWCEEVGVEDLEALTGRHMDAYERQQRQQVAKTTVKNRMKDLRMAVRYWERIGAVEEDLAEKVPVRYPDKYEEVSDDTLFWEDAAPLLRWYGREGHAGSRNHALLELLWNTGARLGGIRALDLRDFYPEKGVVWFRDRSDMGTPLKNGRDGERVVSVSPRVVAALETYIEDHRNDVADDHGRHPLFTSRVGRPAVGTFRQWTYRLTQPCQYGECPHGREPETCEATERQHESKCPSSKSTHPIRKGSISWQLSNRVPKSVVRVRCDASEEVIERHYDMRSDIDRALDRRESVLPNLNYA
jgi:site-specific recombinase XerD